MATKKFRLFGTIISEEAQRWGSDDVTPSQIESFLRTCDEQDEIEIEKEIRKTNIKAIQVAWVHDEVQFEVEEARAEEFGQLAVEAARRVTDILSFRCPLDAEYHVGNNWMESH